MRKILTGLTLLAMTSVACAYTFDLAENATFKNEKCSLSVGEKLYTKTRSNLILYHQGAVLRIGREEIEFEITDMEKIKGAKILGDKFVNGGKLLILGKQASKTKLKVSGVIVDNTDRETDAFNCGILSLQ